MKIFFVDILSKYTGEQLMAPLGILYLISYARKYYDNYQEEDFIFLDTKKYNKLKFKKIVKIIEKTNNIEKFLICFSMLTENRFHIQEISQKLKSYFGDKCIIIVGGPHVTSDDSVLDNCSGIDIAVKGEGEQTFFEIINKLNKNFNIKSLREVKGISYRENFKIIHNQNRERIFNLDEIPFPAFDKINANDYIISFPVKNRVKEKIKALHITGSRGCVYNCCYCSVACLWERRVTYRSVDNIIREIKFLLNRYNINSILFRDDNFTYRKKNLIKLCEEIINQKISFYWFCLARADKLDYDLLKLMYQAGCRSISFGIESSNQTLLDNVINKDLDLGCIENLVKSCQKIGIYAKAYFTYSYPNEEYVDALKTIEYAKGLKIDKCSLSRIYIYPGTPIYRYALEKNLLPVGFAWFNKYKKYYSVNNYEYIPEFRDKLSDLQMEILNEKFYKYKFEYKQLFTIFKLRNYWQYRDFVLRLRVRIMRILSRWHKKIIK